MVYLVGNKRSKAIAEDIINNFSSLNINAQFITKKELKEIYDSIIESRVVILLIDRTQSNEIFEISLNRYQKGDKITLNIFTEPLSLTLSQKKAIGFNPSIFKSLSGEEYANELLNLIEYYVGGLDKLADERSLESGHENVEEHAYADSNYDYDDNIEKDSSHSKIWVWLILSIIIIGGGIWGHTLYVEKVDEKEKTEALNNESKAWLNFRQSDQGRTIIFLESVLKQQSQNALADEIYENCIQGKYYQQNNIEAEISQLLTHDAFKYDTPVSIIDNLSSAFLEKYSDVKGINSYEEDFWDPVYEVETAGYMKFLIVEPIEPNRFVKIYYSLIPDYENIRSQCINIKWENGNWKIDDFYKDNISFQDYIVSMKNRYTENLFVTGENVWNGFLSNGDSELAVSLTFNVEDGEIITAVFAEPSSNTVITLAPFIDDDYNIALRNPSENVRVLMNAVSQDHLAGKYIVDQIGKSYKIELSKEY